MKKKTSFSDRLWDKTGLSFWEDYSNLLNPKHYNWVNFTFINFYIEYDKHAPEIELEIGLLGFNMRWQHALPFETKQSKELHRRVDDVMKDLDKKTKN